MKEKLAKLTEYVGLYDYWKEKVMSIEKKDEPFDVLDLDDTIFSVQDRVESDEIFQKNRGEKGNLLITNELGLKNITDTHYKDKNFPKNILNNVDKEKCLILTAGVREYQEEKVYLMGIQDYNIVVTLTGEDKIIALIRYVIFDLKYIPSSITIYEDRPQYFVEYRDLIEDILGTKIIIKKVVMDGNKGYKSIEEI